MGRITEQMLRRRAEHNEGLLAWLEEVALHQQNIERIELLGQLCPKLQILYLQNNLIPRIENLHKLKDLRYLNLAVNNITRISNLQRCESLAKLDLTINFIPKAGLLGLRALSDNHALRELFLMGNPCADWPHYREYVVGTLPQLTRLDGKEVLPSERIAAAQVVQQLDAQLRAELAAEGVDAEAAAAALGDDDSAAGEAGEGGEETGWVDESGEVRRPWCPATRLLEHREAERVAQEAEAKRAAAQQDPFAPPPPPPRHEDFPQLPDGELPLQRNEGKWAFTLGDSDDGHSVVLEVDVGRHLDTSLIRADVQPRVARLLVKGRLLQLVLPEEVRPDGSTAQRSKTTGALVLTMPKEAAAESGRALGTGARPTGIKAAPVSSGGAIPLLQGRGGARGRGVGGAAAGLRRAAVAVASDDDLPDL